MGAVERRARAREELRGEIVRAARAIVLGEGYAALTMRRIAEAIGYSPASIYQYFESRDAIAQALMEAGFADLLAAFEPARAIADPLAQLDAVGRAYVRFGLERPETYRLMFMEDPRITAELLEAATPDSAGAQAYLAIIEPMTKLASLGLLREGLDPQSAADALWIALHGLVSLKLTCPKFPATPADALLDVSLRATLDGLTRER